MSEWINEASKKPGLGQRVLVACRDRSGQYIYVGTYAEDSGWEDDDGSQYVEVTHWMPLPETPHA